MNETKNVNGQTENLISRRSVVRAAAWTAPVVAMSVAVPAASASAYSMDLASLYVSSSINQPGWPAAVSLLAQTPTKSGSSLTYNLGFPASNVFTVGQNAIISGLSVANQNGTFPITAISGTTITVTNNVTAAAVTVANTAITGMGISGNIVTIGTAVAHSLSVGQVVKIGGQVGGTNLNGSWKVKSVPTTTSFTFQIPSAVSPSNAYSVITLKTGAGSVAGTATSPSRTTLATTTNHGLVPGQVITIASAAPAGYNGTYIVYDTPSSTTFTILTTTTANVTTAGTLSAKYVAGATILAQAPTTYAWIGANPYTAATTSWTDNVGPFPWGTGLMTVTYTFAMASLSDGNSLVGTKPTIQVWKLPNADTAANTTAYDASTTAPSGASAVAEGDNIIADDGVTWNVQTVDTVSNPDSPVVVLKSLTEYSVTGTNSVVYLPRLGVKVTNVANFNVTTKPFKYTLQWEAKPAGRDLLTSSSTKF